jgi:hypothetical protein
MAQRAERSAEDGAANKDWHGFDSHLTIPPVAQCVVPEC